MALISCPECSRQISDQSVSCPNCGYPINQFRPEPSPTNNKPKDKPAGLLSLIICLGLFLFLLSLCSGETSDVPQRQDQKKPVIDLETKASTMINTYEANEVRADAIYKGKTLKVTGTVHSINSDFSNTAILVLAPKGDIYALNGVRASGDANFHNAVISLNKGTTITIICIGDGEIMGSPLLKDCRFS